MSFEPRDYILHMLHEADYLIHESDGLVAAEFLTNQTLQRAFVRSLEIIGEAARKVSTDFRSQNPSIECARSRECGID